jgi:hypothetical protein
VYCIVEGCEAKVWGFRLICADHWRLVPSFQKAAVMNTTPETEEWRRAMVKANEFVQKELAGE